jgi:MFS family permease
VVFLLTIAATLSFIDRQILNVMIGPIKRDLGGLSDTEISLIIGLAFSAVYSLTTLPLARIADRYSRRNVIAAGIFSWSLMTAMAGMANSFWQLFTARMGVGIGEASLGPASTSMLADYFDEHRLPFAYGIVASAPFIGTGLANIVGGPLIDYLEAQPKVILPFFGEMFSWQTVLVTVGLPGILLAAVMFTIKEPQRFGVSAEKDEGFSYKELWEFCLSRIVEFFVRTHGWTRTEIGLSYGFIALFFGTAGSVLAGYFAGYLVAKGSPNAPMRVCFWGTVGLAPLAILMPLLDNAHLALAIVVPITFFMGVPPGLSNAALQAISPNRLRGQMIAVYLICVSFLSYLFAPLIIGLMNDYVFGREDAINLSLSSLAAVNYTIAIACLFLSFKPMDQAIKMAKEFTYTSS